MTLQQRDMFAPRGPSWIRIAARDAELKLLRNFMSPEEADTAFVRLRKQVEWRQDKIRVFGKEHLVPRLHAWYGDAGKVYTWSGIRMDPLPWIAPVERVRRLVEEVTERTFDSVLLNLYRDGDDTVGWHADNEPELGLEPFIASVSLGVERDFQLRHRDEDVERVSLRLPHGSLLIMSGETQKFWQHQVPRRKGIVDARVNLTFRAVGA